MKGQSKKIGMEKIRKDTDARIFNKDILLDRKEWRRMMHVLIGHNSLFCSCILPEIFAIKGLVVVNVYEISYTRQS